MKILFVAVFNEKSTNTSQSIGFKKLGNTVIEYNYREPIQNKVLSYDQRDDQIIEICKNTHPDLVLFSKCNTVNIRVVKECNKITKTALWFMDYIYTMDDELLEKVKYCNYIFISRWDPYYKAKKINTNTFFLQEGFDDDNNIYIPNIDQIYNITFIGSITGNGCHFNRKEYYDAINFKVFNNVYNLEHSKIVCQSKINLNFSEGDGTSDRIYKLMASKGFVLTQPWKNIELDFKIGIDLDIFTSIEDLKTKINYYINNDKLREQIAENGYRTVQKYRRINWAYKIITQIKLDEKNEPYKKIL